MDKPREFWAYFDCFAGISGDMTLGAFIDLGLETRELREVLSLTAQTEVDLKVYRVAKNHLTGVKVEFASDLPQPPRSFGEICALAAQAPVSEGVRRRCLGMFKMLGEVEEIGRAHV